MGDNCKWWSRMALNLPCFLFQLPLILECPRYPTLLSEQINAPNEVAAHVLYTD